MPKRRTTIRPKEVIEVPITYRNMDASKDKAEFIKLYNLAFEGNYYGYPLTEPEYEVEVERNPNFNPEGAWTAWDGERLVGVAIASIWVEEPCASAMRETGFISVVFVHPDYRQRGIGSELLSRCLDWLKRQGRKEAITVEVAPVRFFFLDSENEVAVSFFKRHGFEVVEGEDISMVADISEFVVPDEIREKERQLNAEGIVFRTFTDADRDALLKTLEENMGPLPEKFPPTWYRGFKIVSGNVGKNELLLAVKDGEVVGFVKVWGTVEAHEQDWLTTFYGPDKAGFGPIGVVHKYRGKGIGTVLTYKAFEFLREKGVKEVDLWCGRWMIPFYERLGFRVAKEWISMRKELK